jgi:hypothetical protein
MLKLDDKDKKFIKGNFKNSDKLLRAEDVNEVLDEIDDLIMEKGFISHSEGYNDFGREAQKVYDNILNNS